MNGCSFTTATSTHDREDRDHRVDDQQGVVPAPHILRAWGSSTSCAANARCASRPRTGCSRCRTAVITMTEELGMKPTGKAAIVFQPLGTADFDAIVKEMTELLHATGDETGTTIDVQGRLVRLPLHDPHRPRLRGPRRRAQRRQRGDPRRRLRRPRAVRAVPVQGRPGPRRPLDLQRQARDLLPVRARRPATSSATTSASCSSRPSSRGTSRSRRTSRAGSRSGTSRSDSGRVSRGSGRRR